MANKEFATALKSLRVKFNLTQRQIAQIAEIETGDYSSFERCKRKLGLDDADNLSSKVWGVSYTKFVEFSKDKIDKDKLPLLTHKAIEDSIDVVLKDTDNLFAKELDQLINKGELNSPKTSKMLHSKMKKKLQKRNSTEITSLLNKSPRNKIVTKLKATFHGENIYVHNDFLGEYENLTSEELEHKIELV